MRHQELRLQRVEANKVLGKFDEIYDFIRNSGLYYKINENFGCTVITVTVTCTEICELLQLH